MKLSGFIWAKILYKFLYIRASRIFSDSTVPMMGVQKGENRTPCSAHHLATFLYLSLMVIKKGSSENSAIEEDSWQ